jgi:hypothetical protein
MNLHFAKRFRVEIAIIRLDADKKQNRYGSLKNQ